MTYFSGLLVWIPKYFIKFLVSMSNVTKKVVMSRKITKVKDLQRLPPYHPARLQKKFYLRKPQAQALFFKINVLYSESDRSCVE